jgi:poly-gamma-glutamate synthesis protein (capsule biosynthesis protein)
MPVINFLKKYWLHVLAVIIITVVLLRPVVLATENYFASSPLHLFSPENHLLKTENKDFSPKPETLNTLVFGGDIMLSRTVNQKMSVYNDYSWPFKNISTLFSEADLAIANLESPFLFTNNYNVKTGSFSFKANPKSVQSLLLAGFDVLSLANNHILNQGQQGITDTYKVLSEAGIAGVGTADNKLIIKESKGIKFVFLAYSYDFSSPLISHLDSKQVALDIKDAQTKADVVIILMHAGTEYSLEPNQEQIEFAHAAVDAGADLVIGHHPHWPQTVETYQGKTIVYSLGNLIFDQMWSKETSEGLVVKAYFKDKVLDHIDYIPINIRDYGQAEIMPLGDNRDKMLKNIKVQN